MNLTRRETLQALAAIGVSTLAPGPVLAAAENASADAGEGTILRPGVHFQAALPKEWMARWVTHPDTLRDPVGVYHFRCAFTMEQAAPPEWFVRVSADQRFRLFLNGTFVGSGPAPGDPQHWRYERMDLAPFLRTGRNVLAAVVWYWKNTETGLNPFGVVPGFLLSEETADAANGRIMDTGRAIWRVVRNPGRTFLPVQYKDAGGYTAVGPTERIDAGQYPWGWAEADYDDAKWTDASPRGSGRPRGVGSQGDSGGHALEANPLPAQELLPQPLGKVVRAEGLAADAGPDGALQSSAVTIPPATKARLLIDHAGLTTAMVALETDGGAGAIVRLRYAEALVDAEGKKGNRNEIDQRHCRGYADEFILDGEARTFEPLYWRTFRYLQVEIESAADPVTLRRLTTVFTGAPLGPGASFDASDPQLAAVWEVGVRTLRCNAHETFSDCPYYEQLQYIGDSRLSALISFAIAGAQAQPMVRNALALFDASRIPDGLTQSRYPSTVVQIIPPFSLLYVEMIHDFWMHSGDPADPDFIRGLLPGVRGVLDWFLARTNERGLLGPLPWWNFVDWFFPHGGSPPGAIDAEQGGSSVLTLGLILALQKAAALEEGLGERTNAERDRRAAEVFEKRVRTLCWDAGRGLMADVPRQEGATVPYSQHATALAVLGGLLTPEENTLAAKSLLEAITGAAVRGVTPAGLYFRYYVHRALVAAGCGEGYVDWLEPWRRELALGLTTWPENPSPSRSDCHAWSAHPTRELLTVVLGVESAAPGFRAVTITPRLGRLQWAEGVVPHPQGEISVKLRRRPGGVFAEITAPPTVPCTLVGGGSRRPVEGRFSGLLPQAT